LTSRFAAEWAQEEGVIGRMVIGRTGKVGGMNVEAFTNELTMRRGRGLERGTYSPHQFTALSPDPKGGKARSELYIRDAALARFET
jgi:hypothetical protein